VRINSHYSIRLALHENTLSGLWLVFKCVPPQYEIGAGNFCSTSINVQLNFDYPSERQDRNNERYENGRIRECALKITHCITKIRCFIIY
jgi:hypothetical protein